MNRFIVVGLLWFVASLLAGKNAHANTICHDWTIHYLGTTSSGTYCWIDGVGNGGGGGGGTSGGGGGSGGGNGNAGSGSKATWVPIPAPGSCHDEQAIADGAANAAFKAYWELRLKPQIVGKGERFRIFFSDGTSMQYEWTQRIDSTYAINPVDGALCITGL